MLLGGVRLEACEIVEEEQGLGVESPRYDGDHRHEPVVISLKPLIMIGHLGAVGPVERAGVLRAPPVDRVYDGEIKRQACCARDTVGVQ